MNVKVDVFSTEVFRAKIFKATVDRDFQSKDVYVESRCGVLVNDEAQCGLEEHPFPALPGGFSWKIGH